MNETAESPSGKPAERSLRDLFHLIKRVVPDQQEITSVTAETTVADALEMMKQRGFSQIPVVEGAEVLGVFSYRSLAHAMVGNKSLRDDPLKLPVDNFLERLAFASPNDELAAFFDELDYQGAFLVGRDDQLLAVVTTIDALRYFYRIASGYYVLREIEVALRELIRQSVSEAELKDCIERSLKQHYAAAGRPLPQGLEQLTVNDLFMLLRFGGTWFRFNRAFGSNQAFATSRLLDVPRLRNDVFHFKREITADEYETLRETRNWLLTRIRKLEAHKDDRGPHE
jgi:CBS domain-containing protein